jgi:hypothetical protein
MMELYKREYIGQKFELQNLEYGISTITSQRLAPKDIEHLWSDPRTGFETKRLTANLAKRFTI